RAAWAASPGRSSVLDGMHAKYEHSPPTSSRSTSATRSPPSASAPAQCSPGDPPPRTITSYSMGFLSVGGDLLVPAVERAEIGGVPVPAQPRGGEVPVGPDLAAHLAQVPPQFGGRGAAPEPVPVVDAV